MNKLLSLWSIILGAVLFTLPALAIPTITTPVTDTARVLSYNEVERIASRIRDHQTRTGNQIALLVVPNLEGLPIEDYSLQVARQWGGGQRGVNNGILVVFAIDERRSRIEVGPGLQDRVPDSVAASILHSVRPELRAWRYGDAFYTTVNSLVLRTGGSVSPAARVQARDEDNTGLIIFIILGGILLIVLIVYLIRRSDRGSYGGGYSSNTFIFWDSGSSGGSSSSWGSGGSSNSDGGGGGGGFDGGGGSDSW